MLKKKQRNAGRSPAEARGRLHVQNEQIHFKWEPRASCRAVPRHSDFYDGHRRPRRAFKWNICSDGLCVLVSGGDSKNVAEPGKGQQRHFP